MSVEELVAVTVDLLDDLGPDAPPDAVGVAVPAFVDRWSTCTSPSPVRLPATERVLQHRLAGLPRHRAGVYRQVVRRFLHADHRDRPGLDDARVDQVIDEAAKFAWAFSNTPSGWAERLNARHIKGAVGQLLDPDSVEDVLDLLRARGLLIADGFTDGMTAYRFLHRTFHEYLCAQHLANLPEEQRLTEIRRHLRFNPDWEQVILLLAGTLDDPVPLVHELASQDADPFEHALALAIRAAAVPHSTLDTPAERPVRSHRPGISV